MIQQRLENIQPYMGEDTQTEWGNLFEILADLSDEDGAPAELEDLGELKVWINDEPNILTSRSEKLLDYEPRERLPPLYSQEKLGLDALAQVKFFTLDSSWTRCAIEFDGKISSLGSSQG